MTESRVAAWRRVVLGWTIVVVVGVSVASALPTPHAEAVVTTMTCYTAADGGDNAVTLAVQEDTDATPTHTAGPETVLGALGAADVEAVALAPGGTTLYSANGGVFGTINQTSGAFTAIGSGLGTSTDSVTYNGTTGTYTGGQTINFNTLNDIDGLTFDPFTGKLWGIVRIPESSYPPAAADPPAEYDQLVVIDPATGTFVPQQFRNPGDTTDVTDSVPVTPPAGTNDDINIGDIDDLAIDPSTGVLYGVANAGAIGDQLITIDKTTGRSTIVGTGLGVTDVEGLGFSNVGGLFGEFFATTGDLSNQAGERNRFWRTDTTTGRVIDEDTGTAGFQALHAFALGSGTDYEAMDCLASTIFERQITGFVYVDVNQDGVYVAADGDQPYEDASVRLYIDDGSGGGVTANNDTVNDDKDGTFETGEDRFVDNVLTDSTGFYRFTLSFPTGTTTAPKDFVLEVDTDTLPTGHAMTDGGNEEATFAGDPPNSNDTGQTNGVNNTDGSGNNVNNNFGFTSSPVISKTVVNNVTAGSATALPQAGDTLEYTITVNNTSTVANPITYADVDVTDATPSGTTDVSCTYTVFDLSASTTTAPANCGAAPNRVSDVTLDRGDIITITYRLQVNTPLTITSVDNTACRTINGSSQECDSTSTPIGATLGDVVFHDTDADGTQDPGEPGINGVDVTCTGPTTRTVTTANNGSVDGYYDCIRLAAGNYTADVDQADAVAAIAGVSLSTGNDPTGTIALVAGQDYNAADFGFANTAAIDLELGKTVDDAAPAVGDQVTFTLTLTNNATNATTDATGVTVTDVLPAAMTYVSHTTAQGTYDGGTGVWTVGTVADGATTSMTITASVDSAGTHVNKAQVTADNESDSDSTPANRTFPADAPTEDDEAQASVTTPTAAVPGDPEYIDLELSKDVSHTNVAVGEEVTFTITLENVVPGATGTAMDVRVTDPLPDGLTFVSASPSKGDYDAGTGLWRIGSMRRTEVQTLVIVARAARPGSYRNIAYVSTASGSDIDSTPGDPHDPYQDDEDDAVVVAGYVDLELTKEVSDPTVTIGQEFTYTVDVANVEVPGSPRTPVMDVEVTDAVPDGLRVVRVASTRGQFSTATFIWFVGPLDVGQSATLTLVVVAEREGTFTNVAQVTVATGEDIDSTPGNDDPGEDDQDDAVVVVKFRGTIGDYVWLDHDGDGVQDDDETGIGGILVALAGPFNSRPTSVGAVEAGDSLQTDGDGRYLFQDLEPGLYIVVVMEETVPEGLANTMGTSWYEVNIGPGASFVDADFGYQPASVGLSVLKTVTPSGRVSFGDEPVYTITVSNTGSRTLTDVVLEDTAPDGTTYRPGTATLEGGPLADGPSPDDPLPLAPVNGGLALGDLEPGESRRISFGVTVELREPREIPNVASATSAQTGKVGSNRVVISPAAQEGTALPATGGPVDRLGLVALVSMALGGVTLVSVPRPPAPRHTRRGRSRSLQSATVFFTAHGGFQRPPRRYRR